MSGKRHSWQKGFTDPHRTVRSCRHGCGILQISRHEFEGGRPVHWKEYWRGTERLQCDGTPLCEPQLEEAETA